MQYLTLTKSLFAFFILATSVGKQQRRRRRRQRRRRWEGGAEKSRTTNPEEKMKNKINWIKVGYNFSPSLFSLLFLAKQRFGRKKFDEIQSNSLQVFLSCIANGCREFCQCCCYHKLIWTWSYKNSFNHKTNTTPG